jgi:hypothetical protein
MQAMNNGRGDTSRVKNEPRYGVGKPARRDSGLPDRNGLDVVGP